MFQTLGITMIGLVYRVLYFAITKETTKSRSRLKFVVPMRLKKNETSRSKEAKVMIVRG